MKEKEKKMRAFLGLSAGVIGSAFWYSSQSAQCADAKKAQVAQTALSPTQFRSFPLVSAYDESADTKVLRFALPESDMLLGMDVAACVVVRMVDKDGKEVIRPYTPITGPEQEGYFELMVKKYPNAKMGTYLHGLKKNQTIEVKGPFEKIKIGTNQWKSIGLIAGGTGIAPCYQVARKVLRDPKDKTEITLIAAYKKKEDVLLGNEINELMERYPRFAPYFLLSDPPRSWMGGVGHVNKEMIKALMPPPSDKNSIIMVCGPPGFMQTVSGDKDFSKSPPTQGELKGLLKDLGYTPQQVFKF